MQTNAHSPAHMITPARVHIIATNYIIIFVVTKLLHDRHYISYSDISVSVGLNVVEIVFEMLLTINKMQTSFIYSSKQSACRATQNIVLLCLD